MKTTPLYLRSLQSPLSYLRQCHPHRFVDRVTMGERGEGAAGSRREGAQDDTLAPVDVTDAGEVTYRILTHARTAERVEG